MAALIVSPVLIARAACTSRATGAATLAGGPRPSTVAAEAFRNSLTPSSRKAEAAVSPMAIVSLALKPKRIAFPHAHIA
jgi:hypothetical protein